MIRMEGVSLSFGHQVVLHDLDLAIQSGEMAVLAGKSGCGKSSVLQILLGFVRPSGGRVCVDNLCIGTDSIADIRSRLVWLPQDLRLGRGKVEEVFRKPFTFRRNRSLQPSSEAIVSVLAELGLSADTLDKNIGEVSGGERQRIGIALCLSLKRPVCLLDEPTSALDDASCELVVQFMRKQQGVTILSASHDPRWIEFCSRKIPMREAL